jgi:ATP-dependent DNA ligase
VPCLLAFDLLAHGDGPIEDRKRRLTDMVPGLAGRRSRLPTASLKMAARYSI